MRRSLLLRRKNVCSSEFNLMKSAITCTATSSKMSFGTSQYNFATRRVIANGDNTEDELSRELSPLYPKIKTTRLFTLLYSGQMFSDLALSDATLQRVKTILNDSLFLGVDKPSHRFIDEEIKTRRQKVPIVTIMDLLSYDEKEIAALDNQMQIYQQTTKELAPQDKWNYCDVLIKKINHSLESNEIRRVDPLMKLLTNILKSLGVESPEEHPTICYLMNKRLLHDADREFYKANEELLQTMRSMPKDVFDNDKDVNRKKVVDSAKAEQLAKLLIGDFKFKRAIYMMQLSAEVYDIILEKHREHFTQKEIEIIKSDRERRYYCLIQLHAFVSSLASEYAHVCRKDSREYYVDNGNALYLLMTRDYSIDARKEGKLKSAFRKEASINAFAVTKYIRHLKKKSPEIEKRYPMVKIVGLNATRSLLPHRFRNLALVLVALGLIYLCYLIVLYILDIRKADREIAEAKAQRRREMIEILKPQTETEKQLSNDDDEF
ncbi:predicted protein [Naegleria gruberi]|uniref:Predicted protein n=1 Tax=Naegleria gruberi TaxID=5762 RepID=D2VSB7_NAEGR|nr:uncharacterized protein NAEGRDRAFT_71882 [Naegleria gruberi]EFC40316.1 predicted protein [Naegleria gruberi]|eukprot:XP_002673060.1 predicted protein [Naegleria gruberi strain NEG-M]